jgi:hypothetical protein
MRPQSYSAFLPQTPPGTVPDVTPATGKTKAGITGLPGISRRLLHDVLRGRKTSLRWLRFDPASRVCDGAVRLS